MKIQKEQILQYTFYFYIFILFERREGERKIGREGGRENFPSLDHSYNAHNGLDWAK